MNPKVGMTIATLGVMLFVFISFVFGSAVAEGLSRLFQ